jgi:hypothetical protein
MEFITYMRGAKEHVKIAYRGYIYTKKRPLAKGVQFECEERRNGKICKASLVVDVEAKALLRVLGDHNCGAPNVSRMSAQVIVAEIKEGARTSVEAPHSVVATHVGGIAEGTAVNLPKVRALKRMVQRERRRDEGPVVNPLSAGVLVLRDVDKVTVSGEQFLVRDYTVNNRRTLVFVSPTGIDLLRNSSHWAADGTFKVVPDIFEQLYTIHSIQERKVFAAAFVFLENKSQAAYEMMFEALQEVVAHVPESIIMDFETAAWNAVRTKMPGCDVFACLFHLCQSLWRRLQGAGLSQRYAQDEEFAVQARLIAALAFLPVAKIQDGLAAVAAGVDQDLVPSKSVHLILPQKFENIVVFCVV